MRDLVERCDLIVVTGKGGTGKTTVAAAIGLAAAARGRRTIVAEVSGRDEIGQALTGRRAEPFDERPVDGDDLWHVSIDPEHAMGEYLVDQLPSRRLADVLTQSRLFVYFAAATPGMRELLTVGKVWELAQPDRRTPGGRPYDLVVLDAPATGHGVAVLDAPRTFADAARVGPIARQGRTISTMLSDPARTGVVAVATPEEMPVTEALALREHLTTALPGQDLAAAVVNGVLPDRFTAAEAESLGDRFPAVGALHHRARAHRAQASRLRRGLGDSGVPVVALPFVVASQLGADELRGLARRLAA